MCSTPWPTWKNWPSTIPASNLFIWWKYCPGVQRWGSSRWTCLLRKRRGVRWNFVKCSGKRTQLPYCCNVSTDCNRWKWRGTTLKERYFGHFWFDCSSNLQNWKLCTFLRLELIVVNIPLTRWCIQCQDLQITWKKHSISYIYKDERVFQYTKEAKQETENIIAYDLIWMKKLQSFTYIEDNSEANTYWSDSTRHKFFKRLFNVLKPQLERLCVQVPNLSTKYGACIISTQEDYFQDRYDFSFLAKKCFYHNLGMFIIFPNLQSFTGELHILSVRGFLFFHLFTFWRTVDEHIFLIESQEWQLFSRRHQTLRDLHMFFKDMVHYNDQDLATVCVLPNVDKLRITDCENNASKSYCPTLASVVLILSFSFFVEQD